MCNKQGQSQSAQVNGRVNYSKSVVMIALGTQLGFRLNRYRSQIFLRSSWLMLAFLSQLKGKTESRLSHPNNDVEFEWTGH